MFSFFKPAEKNRLEKCELASQFLTNFEFVKAKEQNLAKAAASAGYQSLAESKYLILKEIVTKVNMHMLAFNRGEEPYHTGNDNNDLLSLMKAVHKNIEQVLSCAPGVLGKQRSDIKKRTVDNLELALVGSGLANLALGPLGVVSNLALLIVGPGVASMTIQKTTGLNDKQTASAKIMTAFVSSVEGLIENLTLEKSFVAEMKA